MQETFSKLQPALRTISTIVMNIMHRVIHRYLNLRPVHAQTLFIKKPAAVDYKFLNFYKLKPQRLAQDFLHKNYLA